MALLFAIVSFVVVGFLYVWYLRVAAKWTLGTSVNRKLCWIFFALVLVVTLVNVAVSTAFGRPGFVLVGVAAHLLLGGWFFGKFAVNGDKVAPGFVGGLKMTGAAMVLLGVTCGVLIAVPTLLLSSKT